MFAITPGVPLDARSAVQYPAVATRLRNGLVVTVRSVTPGDAARLEGFLRGLSLESRRRRFFGTAIDLTREGRRGAASDGDHHGLIALDPDGAVAGHAIYVRMPGAVRAEVAVEVADDLHDLGLATRLLIRLAQVADEQGITRFFAEVLAENREMLEVFRAGFAAVGSCAEGVNELEFPTSSWRAARIRYAP